MIYRQWIKTFFLTFGAALAAVTLVNAVADPMLVLPFVHGLNNRVRFINERQQKTNQLYFSRFYGTKDFDGVILGSSRSSNLDPALFAPQYSVYNYAAAASRPEEAVSYASFAQRVHGRDLRVIIIGLDFMSANGVRSKSRVKGGVPVSYVQDVYKPFFTMASLFNLKALHLSTRILRANLHATKEVYYQRDRMTNVTYFRPSAQEQKAAFDESMRIYRDIYHNFRYNPDYKTSLEELKAHFPNTRFIAFTTPVAVPHLKMIAQEGITQEYRRWLEDVVNVFGEVWHFMDENEVSLHYEKYFSDSHHLYVEPANLITRRILLEPGLPEGFGKKLTPQTLPAYLDTLTF